MPLTQTFTPRPASIDPREAPIVAPAWAPARSAEVTRILDDLVDAIDIRESYEPEVSGWDTAHSIRRLERELARAWTAMPRPPDASAATRRWPL